MPRLKIGSCGKSTCKGCVYNYGYRKCDIGCRPLARKATVIADFRDLSDVAIAEFKTALAKLGINLSEVNTGNDTQVIELVRVKASF
jgi:hypothetical protein